MARELHPGKRNSLDALCDRYGVSNAHRTLHGALLDSELLAEVYLAMTRGQESFEIALDTVQTRREAGPQIDWPPRGLRVQAPTPDELDAHEAALAAIGKERRGTAIWSEAPPG
jgi:DNA polymerase-3 subunit epsilon